LSSAGAAFVSAAFLAQLRAHVLAALSAAGGNAKFVTQGFESRRALRDRGGYLSVGYSLANTDVHVHPHQTIMC
jgi:hypothetical protein